MTRKEEKGVSKVWARWPVLVAGGVLAICSAVAAGVLSVPAPWGEIALGGSIFLTALGVHTQVRPAVRRRGKLK